MPTVFIVRKYRFFFNSREEKRMHVHIASPDGVAKFWLEPIISLADYYNLTQKELRELKQLTEKNQNEIIKRWKKHFGQ